MPATLEKKSDRARYKDLFFSFPTLRKFWDESFNRTDIGAMCSARGLSSGEGIIVKCLVSIWRGTGEGQLVDFTDVACLPPETRKPLVMYLVNPCKP